jgi:UDP-glucose 4-epimerase
VRRILITGVSAAVGGRVAQALERDPGFEAVIGVDTDDPRHEFRRTEFVRVALERRPLSRIIAAAGIDTVLDTRLIDHPLSAPAKRIEAANEAGTAELIAACAAQDTAVTRLIVKSSAAYYGHGPGRPAFLTEDTTPQPRTAIERSIQATERMLREHQARHPQTKVSIIRFPDVIGGDSRAGGALAGLLQLPVVPAVLGFDPRLATIHHEDVVGALVHAARHDLQGAYNASADGVLTLSEMASLLGKTLLPILPPVGTGFAAAQLRRLGLRAPVELVRQLRHGRALDNRRLKASGFAFAYTSREALVQIRAQQQLRPLLTAGGESYRYEPDLEEFLRWSPSVRGHGPPAAGQAAQSQPAQSEAALSQAAASQTTTTSPGQAATSSNDAISQDDLVELIDSLDDEGLRELRSYEEAHRARPAVLEALGRSLARRTP